MEWPQDVQDGNEGMVRSAVCWSLRSQKSLLQGLDLSVFHGGFSQGFNNLFAWGFAPGQGISRFSTPPTPWGTSVAQSVFRDLMLLGGTSCTLDPNAMKVAVPRLKATSG